MVSLRNRVEQGFEDFAHFVYRHRIKTAIIMLLLMGAVISQIPKITIDTSTEGFLHENDPTLLAYNAFRDQFGRDEVVIIAIKSSNIFSQGFLKKLKELHEDLEQNVPLIDDITSLVNARNTRGETNELLVEDLLEDWPQSETEMAVLKNRVISNPLYKNLLISEDGQFTAIVIKTHSYSGIGQETDVLEGFDDGMGAQRFGELTGGCSEGVGIGNGRAFAAALVEDDGLDALGSQNRAQAATRGDGPPNALQVVPPGQADD